MEIICPQVTVEEVLNNDQLWSQLPKQIGFKQADGRGQSQYHTEVQVCWDQSYLYVGFYCDDQTVLSDYAKRDDPLYEQEVVEVFIAPQKLTEYYEFNVSPRNVVFDSLITNTLDGSGFRGEPSWDSPSFVSMVKRVNLPHDNLTMSQGFGPWIARLGIPFIDLRTAPPKAGDSWGINFYRIKRKPVEEYSCWSPTFRNPAFFHVPQHFGKILFVERQG